MSGRSPISRAIYASSAGLHRDDVLDHGPLTPGRALEIAQDTCAALVTAHQVHVIHYDIKPLNVMLTADGRAKVVDFGIAGFIQTTFTVAWSADLAAVGTPSTGRPSSSAPSVGTSALISIRWAACCSPC
jgi:serine/threonine protein kinase